MGGFGSGKWFRVDTKQTTRRLLALDVRKARRKGLIAPGQEQMVVPDGVLPLTWTSMPWGGARPWFVCPGTGCGRRVAILYLDHRRCLLCRHCLDLAYESQRERQVLRAKRRAEKARARLVAPDEDLPTEKPKHMHRRTFVRLGRAYVKAHREHVALYNTWWGARSEGLYKFSERAAKLLPEEQEIQEQLRLEREGTG